MIKIVEATVVRGSTLRLEFSDGRAGDLDIPAFLARDTSLTRPLREPEYFRRFFLELGALCWPNGLELSAGSLYRAIEQRGALEDSAGAA